MENAILHGILEKDPPTGTIVITAWEKGDVYLLVSDDGVGIPKEILDQLLQDSPMTKTKGSNMVIYNIHTRLKLLYGSEYGLHYSSEPGRGTEVTIRLPGAKSAEEKSQ